MSNNQDDNKIEAGAVHVDKSSDNNAETIEAVPDDKYPGARDRAGQLLKEAGHTVIVTPQENKRILRKIDLAILPVLLTVYCLQSLDKTSLAYASVFGLIEHANLVDQEYSWLGAIVYVAQLVWQPVVAYFLVKFPIGEFLSFSFFLLPSNVSANTLYREVLCDYGLLLGCSPVWNDGCS